MTKTLELPDPVYEALEQAASASGTTPVGWIESHLQTMQTDQPTANGSETPKRTLADRFAGHVGGFSSGGKESFSQNAGERFTEYLLQKRREGRL